MLRQYFNFDIPQDDEYYVHRIGRTGRAGRTGKAFSFVKGKEVYKLKDIHALLQDEDLCTADPILRTMWHRCKAEKMHWIELAEIIEG